MSSDLRRWVMDLPFREQGTLIVALRGCDSAPKFPLDSPERRLVAALRYAVLIPADKREVDSAKGCFMLSEPPTDVKLGMLEHYPQHWVGHVIHAVEVCGYHYPDPVVAAKWRSMYFGFCKSLHMNPETEDQMVARMTEDRVATNTVVAL